MAAQSGRDLVEGAEFGPVTVAVDRARLVAYAAASGDHNRIHWDSDFARGVGLPDVIAHGMWTMGAASGALEEWVGDPAAILSYGTKFSAPVVVPPSGDVDLEVRGRVKSVADGRATVLLEVTCAGEQVLNRAQAVVAVAGAGTRDESGAAGA